MRSNQQAGVIRSGFLRLALVVLATVAGIANYPQTASAQVGFGAVGGVYVDAAGMLRDAASLAQDDRLKRQQSAAGEPSGAVALASPLRKISLPRLEAVLEKAHQAGGALSDDVLHLAGLQRVQYVFLYPETNDVVLAGPAGPWRTGDGGDVVDKTSGRPVLHLDDLLVALRYAFAEVPTDGFLGCSIEPTDEGMRKHAEFVGHLQGFDRSQASQVTRGMERAMGPQRALIYGVPPSSRFALELLAADYRLKRLALAHDRSPTKKVPSFLDLAAKNISGGPQPQHRWWFVGQYDAIVFTGDRLAWEFQGNGLRVDTAPTKGTFTDDGPAVKPGRAATQFAELASREMDDLARSIPSFASLHNLVSLAVAAELIRRNGEGDVSVSDESSNWRPNHFLDAGACPIAEWPIPKQVPSLANARLVKDRHWLFSTSGGVEITPGRILDGERTKSAGDNRLEESRRAATRQPDPQRWWWD